MNAGYYQVAGRAEQLEAEARSWLGTPFHKRSQIKGPRGGVDCFPLLGAINYACGLVPPIDLTQVPDYATDWSAHNETGIMEGWLYRWLDGAGVRYARIERVEDTAPGDVLLFAPGKCIHHMGQRILHGWFVHAMTHSGVIVTQVDHRRFKDYFRYALRPLEVL